MKAIVCVLALLCLWAKVNAQAPLAIGDELPGLVLPQTLRDTVRTSDFRGKLLILDFWATWCSPCIRMLPKTDSLQQAFRDKVQFLPVTYQKAETVQRLLSRLPAMNLPFVTGDSVLHRLFPHRELPHYVWIDPQGKVAAFTGHQEITGAHLQRFLDSALIRTTKQDRWVDYHYQEPFFQQGLSGSVLFQSVISGYVAGLPSRYDLFRNPGDRDLTRITALNCSLVDLFALAYSEGKRNFTANRIFLDVADSAALLSKKSGQAYHQWLEKHGYCYELILPPALAKEAFVLMQKDLHRFFPQYKVRVEKRMQPCLALIRTTKEDNFQSKGGNPSASFSAFRARMVNTSLKRLVAQLSTVYLQHLPYPVIDRTGYSGKVDLALDASLSKVEELQKALAPYGLDLVKKQEEIEVLIIMTK
ncbi:redoxin domain-containing protein [Rapidithrix thailandica]|uniref:Redoxin domain-containing protein n=1 Tax=Rapidithrix thailandica TaxID=413964 RepID=A0AAW9RUQ1_9BACT